MIGPCQGGMRACEPPWQDSKKLIYFIGRNDWLGSHRALISPCKRTHGRICSDEWQTKFLRHYLCAHPIRSLTHLVFFLPSCTLSGCPRIITTPRHTAIFFPYRLTDSNLNLLYYSFSIRISPVFPSLSLSSLPPLLLLVVVRYNNQPIQLSTFLPYANFDGSRRQASAAARKKHLVSGSST